MTRRTGVAAIVLIGWAVGFGLLVTRELNPSMADRLAEVALRIVPITTYYIVERDGRHVGFASIEIDTVPRTLQITEYLVMDGEQGSRVTDQVTVNLSRSLGLRDFRYLRGGAADTMKLIGTVADSSLIVDRGGLTDTIRLTLPAFAGAIAHSITMFLDEPRVGSASELPIIDPATARPGRQRVRVAAESLLVVVDSAVADSSGRWFAVHRDTVRAWRLLSDSVGPPVDVWMDAQGLVVEARRPDGLVLRRTAFELAFENWRNAGPGQAVSARADGNVLASTWLASGARRPDVVLDTLRVRLGADVPRAVGEWFGGRARPGSIRTVVRAPADRLQSRYSFPTTERWRATVSQFLEATPLLEVDDPAIARRAARLRGDETDPLAVVRRIAEWVGDALRPEAGVVGQTARDAMDAGGGDAREFALVFTALARAAGVPARLASGLLYHDGRFYAHAWSLVYIGRWIPVDAMLGQVPADASHLDFSYDAVDLGPDLVRVLSRVDLSVTGEVRAR